MTAGKQSLSDARPPGCDCQWFENHVCDACQGIDPNNPTPEAALPARLVTTVGDLSDADHRGWLIRVAEPAPVLRREFVLGKGFGSGVRRWEYEGVEMVGLTDDVRSPGIIGTERAYPADTPCELIRPVTKPRKRVSR